MTSASEKAAEDLHILIESCSGAPGREAGFRRPSGREQTKIRDLDDPSIGVKLFVDSGAPSVRMHPLLLVRISPGSARFAAEPAQSRHVVIVESSGGMRGVLPRLQPKPFIHKRPGDGCTVSLGHADALSVSNDSEIFLISALAFCSLI